MTDQELKDLVASLADKHASLAESQQETARQLRETGQFLKEVGRQIGLEVCRRKIPSASGGITD